MILYGVLMIIIKHYAQKYDAEIINEDILEEHTILNTQDKAFQKILIDLLNYFVLKMVK